MKPNIKPLLYLMQERHLIYLRRQQGAKWPWTKDQILQTYSFCNTYRELDKVTVWIRENIRKPYAKHPHLWFLLAAARQINWPDTLDSLLTAGALPTAASGFNYSASKTVKIMEQRSARGEKVYTGAYIINGAHGNDPRCIGKSKPHLTAHRVLGTMWQNRTSIAASLGVSLEHDTKLLSQYPGWGDFMAYEVATDMRHTRYLRKAPDIMTWANAGPGAKRGLNRLHGRPLGTPLKAAQSVGEMQQLLKLVSAKWPTDWQPLEMRDIEHSLCECDKYLRVKAGEGRPRAKYNQPMEQ